MLCDQEGKLGFKGHDNSVLKKKQANDFKFNTCMQRKKSDMLVNLHDYCVNSYW